MKRASSIVFALLATLALAGAAAADGIQVLGSDGTIYNLLDDTYAALFGDGGEAEGDSRVLGLERIAPDGTSQRYLVPETSSASAEVAAQLVYDQATDTVFVLWEGILNELHPLLFLASFQDDGWGGVQEISGDPFARKGHPQLGVTRDRDQTRTSEDGEALRTTLHIVWWEETSGGTRKRYAPVVVSSGATGYTWHPTWDLSSFLEAVDAPPVAAYTELVRLAPGSTSNNVLVGFLTTGGDRIASVEANVLPPALAGLADAARFHITVSGLRWDSIETLAADVERFIRETGDGFDPEALDFLAEHTAAALRNERLPLGGTDLGDLGDAARFHIINSGLRIANHGISSNDAYQLIEVERLDQPGTFDVLKISVLSDRPVPAEAEGPFDLFLSVDGRHAIVSWRIESGSVAYVESTDDGWGPARYLTLREGFSLEDAHAMLDGLARSR